jgi:hypothetical protein
MFLWPAFPAAAALLDVGKRLAQLTARQLAAVEPLLDEELAEAVRLCSAIPRRNKVSGPSPRGGSVDRGGCRPHAT